MKNWCGILCAVLLAVSVLAMTSCRQPLRNGGKEAQSQNAAENMTELCLKPADGYVPTDDELRLARKFVGNVVDMYLRWDHSAEAADGETQIIVRYSEKEQPEDVEKMKTALMQKGGKLTFRAGYEYAKTETDADGKEHYLIPAGESETILMDGSAVDYVGAQYYQDDESRELVYTVYLELTAEGAESFENISTEYIDRTVSIWLDDEMISAPTINAPISDGKLQISGGFTAEEAQALSDKINLGLIPFPLVIAD